MALTERSRSVLYQGFMSVVNDEQAVQEMLGYFPARDLEEPVTRDVLHAEMAGLRTEFAEFRTGISGEFAEFRNEMRGEMENFRTGMRGEMEDFRNEMRGEMEDFRTGMRGEMEDFRIEMRGEMDSFRREVTAEIHRMLGWNLAAFVSMAAVIVAAVRL